jgi:hypothetical protein
MLPLRDEGFDNFATNSTGTTSNCDDDHVGNCTRFKPKPLRFWNSRCQDCGPAANTVQCLRLDILIYKRYPLRGSSTALLIHCEMLNISNEINFESGHARRPRRVAGIECRHSCTAAQRALHWIRLGRLPPRALQMQRILIPKVLCKRKLIPRII